MQINANAAWSKLFLRKSCKEQQVHTSVKTHIPTCMEFDQTTDLQVDVSQHKREKDTDIYTQTDRWTDRQTETETEK